MTGAILNAWWQTQSGLTALVRNPQPWSVDPGDARPYVAYFVVDDQGTRSLGGPSGITTARLQVEVIADTYAQAQQIARLIRGSKSDRRFDGFKGDVTVTGGATVRVQAVLFAGGRDEYDQSQTAKSTGPFRVVQDYTVTYEN